MESTEPLRLEFSYVPNIIAFNVILSPAGHVILQLLCAHHIFTNVNFDISVWFQVVLWECPVFILYQIYNHATQAIIFQFNGFSAYFAYSN